MLAEQAVGLGAAQAEVSSLEHLSAGQAAEAQARVSELEGTAAAAKGRFACWEADSSAHVEYIEGDVFDELRFGPEARTFRRSSVLLLPDLLSPTQRQQLREVSELAAFQTGMKPRMRITVANTSEGTSCCQMWRTALMARVMEPIAAELPGLFSELFPSFDHSSTGAESCAAYFEDDGPIINRWCDPSTTT